MFKKRGKMGQPVKNGTRYKKCTLAPLRNNVLQVLSQGQEYKGKL